jgi:single-strand DNA-binding protein
MLNRVTLVGRLTRDPELRRTQSGVAVTNFTLAVDNRFSRTQERTASFFNVVCWNQTAENVAKFMKKGSLVGVDGRLEQRTFDRRDGSKGQVIEVIADQVVFLEPKNVGEESAGYEPDEQGYQEETPTEDDLPF